MTATEIARALAGGIDRLVRELLPAGRREGHEWRAGSTAGEAGSSLGVCLVGRKAGIWCDFATSERGDALDLVRATLKLDMPAAIVWARRWLGIDNGAAELPRPWQTTVGPARNADDPERWRRPWLAARPIAGTLSETYLQSRGLAFGDRAGGVLRFARRRARKNPSDELEYHPALLALMRDVRTGEPCGLINIYLRVDGRDRIRDKKGKTCTSRAKGAAVMLGDFETPTMGLVVCEGVETGIALCQAGLRPVWACGGAGNLKAFPLLGGIEALTIAADQGEAGMQAAEALVQRWRAAGRTTAIVAAPVDDWATPYDRHPA